MNKPQQSARSLVYPEPLSSDWSPSDKGRILLVEDDIMFREALEHELTQRGFSVRSLPDGTVLLAATGLANEADVVLLDWSLPQLSGLDLLVHLRAAGIKVPVAFLTGRALTANENLAFEKGAIDFIDKSRGVDVLVKRLSRIIATSTDNSVPQANTLQLCGHLTLRPQIGRAEWKERDVCLTFGEYNVIHLLASNVGTSITYRAIYDRMHYVGFVAGIGDDGYRTNVRSAIKRIRGKFRAIDPQFEEIQNCAAIGYSWGTPVTPA